VCFAGAVASGVVANRVIFVPGFGATDGAICVAGTGAGAGDTDVEVLFVLSIRDFGAVADTI
jgi:hypothetical protein